VTLGGNSKQLKILIAVVVLGGVLIWYENSDSSSSSSPATHAAPVAAPLVRVSRSAPAERRRASSASLANEFQPRLGPRTPEERVDPATIDPTLRLDLLAKVQAVDMGPPGRNLFDFGSAPAPEVVLPKKVEKIMVNNHPPATAPSLVPGPPATPTAPQMTFKYYGYKVSSSDGRKAAFLLDGDDILVAGENDTVKHRYKVVKIGVNSITIEDTQFKSTQTLPLQEQIG